MSDPMDAARKAAADEADRDRPGATVIVADDEESMRHFLRRSLGRHGFEVVAVESGDQAIERYEAQPFDVAVLDPPRRGAGPAMEAVCATRPRGIVLVSCHPTSLARDLQLAEAQGYQLAQLELHDLFPLTSHVESVALLTRR